MGKSQAKPLRIVNPQTEMYVVVPLRQPAD